MTPATTIVLPVEVVEALVTMAAPVTVVDGRMVDEARLALDTNVGDTDRLLGWAAIRPRLEALTTRDRGLVADQADLMPNLAGFVADAATLFSCDITDPRTGVGMLAALAAVAEYSDLMSAMGHHPLEVYQTVSNITLVLSMAIARHAPREVCG